jgi:hypothetical protein
MDMASKIVEKEEMKKQLGLKRDKRLSLIEIMADLSGQACAVGMSVWLPPASISRFRKDISSK